MWVQCRRTWKPLAAAVVVVVVVVVVA